MIATTGTESNSASAQGVYPIKVNQQRQVVEEIAEFGTKYDYGLEAGSKPELIAMSICLVKCSSPGGLQNLHK